MKKKILLILIFVFVFFWGNIDIVIADYYCYVPTTYLFPEKTSYGKNDYIRIRHSDERISSLLNAKVIPNAVDSKGEKFKDVNIVADLSKATRVCETDYYKIVGGNEKYEFFIYSYNFVYNKNGKNINSTNTFVCLGTRDNNILDLVGMKLNAFVGGLPFEQTTNLCQNGQCLCPVMWLYQPSEFDDISFGVGTSQVSLHSSDYFPKKEKNNLVCHGSNNFQLVTGTIDGMLQVLDKGGEITAGEKKYNLKSYDERKATNAEIKSYFDIAKDANGNILVKFKDQNMANKFYSADAKTAEKIEASVEVYEAKNLVAEEYRKLQNKFSDTNYYTRLDAKGYTCDDRCGPLTKNYCDYYKKVENKIADIEGLSLEELEAITQYSTNYINDNNVDDNGVNDALDDYVNTKTDTEELVKSLGIEIPKIDISTIAPLECDGIIDPYLKEVIQWVLNLIRIAVPILLIVLCTVDFGQAMISQSEDEIKKATSKVIKRIIAALVLFLVPTLVNVFLDMPGISDYTSKTQECAKIFWSE